MKAAVNPRYGSPDVIEVREVPKPEPRAGDVLVKVHATTVSRRLQAGDLHAVIDRRYPPEAIVDAYRYVEAGQKTRIVVIDVAQANPRTVAPELQRDA